MRRILKGLSILLLGVVLIITSSAGTYAGPDQGTMVTKMEEPQTPGISIELQRDEISYKPGESIEYSIIVKNTGDVELKDLKLNDLLQGEKSIESLKVAEELIFEEAYAIPLDIKDEFVANKVTVTAEVDGAKVEASDSFEAYMERMSSIEDMPEEPDSEDQTEEERKHPKVEEKSDIEEPLDDTDLAENYPPMKGEPPIQYKGTKRLMASPIIEDTIEVDKTAIRSLPGCRTFEVTLDIMGTPQNAPVDVALIIDRSGSMNDGDVDEYVPITDNPDNNGSYYVKVNGNYQTVTKYSGTGANSVWRYGSIGSRRYVKWDPTGDDNGPGSTNSNNPVGKPFYERFGRSRLYYAKQAAANFADRVLGPGGIPGSRVSVVSFSGPSSTTGSGAQSQARTDIGLTEDLSQVIAIINGITATGGTNTQAGFLQGRSVIEDSGNLVSNKVVIMFTDGMPTASNGNRYGPDNPTSHNVHTRAAYEAGQGIHQNSIADVFTVGLLSGMSGSVKTLAVDTLTKAQNKGFYEAPTAADLDRIFTEISQKLGYSATKAVVKDKIGENFNLVEESLPEGVTYDPGTREITWKPGTIVEHSQLKYILQAKPGFDEGLAGTNEYARLTYTDANGISNKIKDFPVPNVYVPAKLKASLTDATITLGDTIQLGTGTDPYGENYMSPITGGDGDGTYTYEWRIKGQDDVISSEKNPEVGPTEDTEYELTVMDSNGCKAVATMWVRVREPVGFITITKEVINPKNGDTDKVFDIFVYGPGNKLYVVTLKHNESKTISNLPLGDYRVEEVVPMNYKLMGSTNNGEVELTRENLSGHVTVRNKRTNDGWFHDDDEKGNKFTIRIRGN